MTEFCFRFGWCLYIILRMDLKSLTQISLHCSFGMLILSQSFVGNFLLFSLSRFPLPEKVYFSFFVVENAYNSILYFSSITIGKLRDELDELLLTLNTTIIIN